MNANVFHGIELAENSSITNMSVEKLDSDPSVITAGRTWYNTTQKKFKHSKLNVNGMVVVDEFVNADDLQTAIQGVRSYTDQKVANLNLAGSSGTSSIVTITGSASNGAILTATLAAGWTAASFQWTRDGVDIADATSSTYTINANDSSKTISCKVSGLVHTPTGISVPALISASRYMLDSHGVVPNYRLNTATPETLPAQTYHVSSISINRPSWNANNIKFAFQNAYTNNTGATPAELLPPTSITVRAALFNGDTFVANMTFSGQQEVTIAAGDLIWTDAIPASVIPSSGQLYVRTYSALPSGGQRPGRRQNTDNSTGNGFTYVYATATQSAALALLSSGTVANNSGYPNNYAFGPVCQVADMWDGRPVVLIVGDSIAAGNDNAIGASWISNALRSSVGGVMSYYNMAIHGTKASNQTGDAAYGKKAAIIDSLIAMNEGDYPMTAILSEMGVNDASGTNGTSLQTKVQAWLNYLDSKWPSAKLIQTTYTPRVTSDAATLQTDESVMATTTVTGSTADRWFVADWIKTKPAPLDGFIDVREAWTGSPTGTFWKVPSWTASLTQAVAAGATSITVDVAPPAGVVPVLSPGSSTTVESTGIPITTVTGSGPYTLTLGKALTKSHLVGAIVKASPSVDGLHPEEGYASALAQAVVEQAKTAGIFITG